MRLFRRGCLMAEPVDRDGEAGQPPSPDSDGSGEGLSEDDLDIDTLVSVWKDDLLLDAIGRAPTASDRLDVPFDVSADDRLIEALLSWRREIESDPVTPAAPDPVLDVEMDPAVGGSRRRGFRVPLVSALAAAVVIVCTAVAAYGAAPNEALWPVTEVLYSQHAESVRAAHDVGVAQAQASTAMASGHPHDADAALHAAANLISRVQSQDGRTELQNRQRDLARQLDAAPGPAAAKARVSDPGTPPHNSKAVAAPSPTSQPSSHSSVPEGSSVLAAGESQDSAAQAGSATATAQPQATPQPASVTSASRQHPEQPANPPRPSRSAVATATQPARSAAPTTTGAAQPSARPVRPVKPSKTGSSQPTTPPSAAEPTPSAAPATGHTVEPSSSIRKTEGRHTQVASSQLTSPTRTPQAHTSPSSQNVAS
jgi:hypothetical protein